VGDGGGLAPTARRPVTGRDTVVGYLSRFNRLAPPDVELVSVMLNGSVGLRIDPGGELDTAIAFAVDGGRITRVYAMRNPHKLGRLDAVTEVRR
jgi:RNA polymerase sigma-70 factor (ECF subfamily)